MHQSICKNLHHRPNLVGNFRGIFMFLTEEKVKGIGDFDDFCMPSKISEQKTGVFSIEAGWANFTLRNNCGFRF